MIYIVNQRAGERDGTLSGILVPETREVGITIWTDAKDVHCNCCFAGGR